MSFVYIWLNIYILKIVYVICLTFTLYKILAYYLIILPLENTFTGCLSVNLLTVVCFFISGNVKCAKTLQDESTFYIQRLISAVHPTFHASKHSLKSFFSSLVQSEPNWACAILLLNLIYFSGVRPVNQVQSVKGAAEGNDIQLKR